MYHYAGNNPINYIDPDGRWLINDTKDFNLDGKTINAESYAKNNYEKIKETRGYSTRLGWWKINDKYELVPLYSTTRGFKNDVQFSDTSTMRLLKSMANSQKNQDPYLYQFVFTEITTETNSNGVISVKLTFSRIIADCFNNIIDETKPVTVTVAFTTEEELTDKYRSRDEILKIIVKDALKKANIDLEI